MEKGKRTAHLDRETQSNLCPPVTILAPRPKALLTSPRGHLLFPFLVGFLPGSSVAEQVTVNHLVAGSTPARAANERLQMHPPPRGVLEDKAIGPVKGQPKNRASTSTSTRETSGDRPNADRFSGGGKGGI